MKQEILVPTSLNEINLSQYQALLRVMEDNDSEDFIRQKMLSLFCKIPLSQVVNISYKSLREVTDTFQTLLEAKHKFIPRFEMNKTEFGFIPDLENISMGEYTDLDKYVSDWQTMHNAMAVMFRPITKRKGEQYEIEKYEGSITYADVMKFAPLDVVLGAMVFFYDLRNELLKATHDFLSKEIQEMIIQQNPNLESNGAGIIPSMLLHKETLEDLTK